ncbi:MAG: LCP family protein [Candidatus Saccharibacteria bacterium]|nr:LCP family protein [Candidatus Saccharibacteria bacterium]
MRIVNKAAIWGVRLRRLLVLVAGIAAALLIYRTWSSGLLPGKYQIGAYGVLLVVYVVTTALLLMGKNRLYRAGGAVMALLVIAVSSVGITLISRGDDLLSRITTSTGHTVSFSVIVHADSPMTDITHVAGKPLRFAEIDESRAREVKTMTGAAELVSLASYADMARMIQGDTAVIGILNESYRTAIEATDEQFSRRTRVLKTFHFTEDVKQAAIEAGKPFTIYISGIDTYGPIATVSRSDVNILMTVNPEKHKVHITTVPRDAYVAIPGAGRNQKDKLTHSGIYGVETSVKTLEQLFAVTIDGYVRINFTSFMAVIDKIGGVVVDNPRAFTAYNGKAFPAGSVTLNGADALAFARERKSLGEGDVGRGRNQMIIIEAILRKLLRANSLASYDGVLEVLGSSVQTNITDRSLRQLINQQVADDWQVTSAVVSGRGQTGGLPSFAMPGYQLYMYVLDASSVEKESRRIRELR